MNILTVIGIRPDFIRMSQIIKKFDQNFRHTVVHTGQHFDYLLSDVFFKELEIRKPDYNLDIGGVGKEHFHQNAELSVKLIELIRNEKLNPDLIVFLGDSNSVLVAASLKKEGYRIVHIEAGMRSGDKRMLEEINRIVCDHCSDIHFVYHVNYKEKLIKENIPSKDIHVVGNTIVEVCNPLIPKRSKKLDKIVLDVHRPENFKYKNRLSNIINFANVCSEKYDLPVKMLDFKRTTNYVKEFGLELGKIELVDLMSYVDYIEYQYDCKFMISDSGTAQEEPALLGTPVIVPRDFTERPESVENCCSFMLDVNFDNIPMLVFDFLNNYQSLSKKGWLGDGKTSDLIVKCLK